MRLLVKNVGEYPKAQDFDDKNLLKELQLAVGGYIETVPISEKLVLILDEEGKLKGRKAINIVLPSEGKITDYVVGPVVVAGVTRDGENFRGLTRQELAFATNWLDIRSV